MKTLLTGAAAAAALLAFAQAEEPAKFDLWQSTTTIQNLIAISGQAEGAPFAVAAGADIAALDILADDEASLAIADLKAKSASAVQTAEAATTETVEKKAEVKAEGGDKPAIHKIVLVKKINVEGDAEAKETRQIIKLKTDKEMDAEAIKALIAEAKTDLAAGDASADVSVEQETVAAEGDDATLLALASDTETNVKILETEENGAKTRLVQISAADADAARQFIDQASGLDDSEKAAMKTKLGL
jgi:hypothetical protein